MSNWKCNICKVEMEEVMDIRITANDMELPEAEGLRCPVCGAEFLESDYVLGQLADAEQMLQGK